MTNLFKRNKTYYIRLSLNDNLKIYFGNKTEYVKSLNTNNINNARLIAKYLISKFNYIKRSFNMFSAKEIKHYIDEFKKWKFLVIVQNMMYLAVLVELKLHTKKGNLEQLTQVEFATLLHLMADAYRFLKFYLQIFVFMIVHIA